VDCQPRTGRPFLADSATEDSWVKKCEVEASEAPEGLLGGLSAMWTDKYCYAYQCGAADPKWGEQSGRLPNAGLMFLRDFDGSFGLSLAGMIWPRAGVSAAALWRYSPELDDAEVSDLAAWLAALLRSNGVASCPPGCQCDELTSCGRPYPVSRPGGANRRNSTAWAGECFERGDRAMLGGVAPGGEKPRPLDEAFGLCFWFGERCKGVGCELSSPSGRSTSAVDSCKLYAPVSGGAHSGDSGVFFVKDMSSVKCAPFLLYQ